jgi:hypothetical protein
MMMSVEQSMERVTGETDVLRENLPQCRFVHGKSHGGSWPLRHNQDVVVSSALKWWQLVLWLQ